MKASKILNRLYKTGTTHHAARGYVCLWGILMEKENPEKTHIYQETARLLLEDISSDERRKDEGEPHVL
jgi:hypothetical protein